VFADLAASAKLTLSALDCSSDDATREPFRATGTDASLLIGVRL